MNNLINLDNINISVTKVRSFEYRKRKIPFVYEDGCRENYGLVFVENGSLIHNKKGRLTKIEKGDILLLKKGEAYSMSDNPNSKEDYYAYYILSFDIDNKTIPYIKRVTNTSHYEKFLDLFREGRRCTLKMSTAHNINIKRIVYEILYNLYLEYYTDYTVSNSIENIEKAKKYINENYRNKISIEQLAKISGFSRSHFKRLFTKHYEMAPSDYITTVRIDRAKTMLRAKIFTLGEIAEECGFSNEYYFSQVFKKIVGCSPRKY